jgi:pimeloyl-ACP methyl ester carboxylesterase
MVTLQNYVKRIHPLLITSLLLGGSTTDCTQRKVPASVDQPLTPTPESQPPAGTNPTNTETGGATDTSQSTADANAQNQKVHIVMVPGWGYQLGPLLKFNYTDYMQGFVDAGVPQDRIHILSYDWKGELEDARLEIEKQLLDILDKGGDDAVIDLMGHSLGAFVGPYAASKMSKSNRIRKFISISGIPYGWDNTACGAGLCGKTHKNLIPFKSEFVMKYHEDYKAFWDKLDKCALFSPADAFVKPYDAGRMEGGVNKEVADMGHLEAIGDKKNFAIMLEACYGNKPPK